MTSVDVKTDVKQKELKDLATVIYTKKKKKKKNRHGKYLQNIKFNIKSMCTFI